jgi:hypothetical protein
MTQEKMIYNLSLVLVFVLISSLGLQLAAMVSSWRADVTDLEQKSLSMYPIVDETSLHLLRPLREKRSLKNEWIFLYGSKISGLRKEKASDSRNLEAQGSLMVEKSVIPEGIVESSSELTYTVIISTSLPDVTIGFYDPLQDVIFKRLVTYPAGITRTQIMSGAEPIVVITGTLPLSSVDLITISFVGQADSKALRWVDTVTNRAHVCFFGATLDSCIWSNEVSNIVYQSLFTLYLPLVLRNPASFSDYYVDCDNGDNNNLGTSADEAWYTLKPVHEVQFEPGDTVHLKRGCAWPSGLVIDDDGEENKPIKFTAYGEGNRPKITNPGDLTRGIEVHANWVIVEELTVENVHIDGVYIPEGYAYNVIRDLNITDVGSGITFNGHHNIATDNYIHDLHMIVNTPGGDDDYGATGIKFRGPYNEATYNHLVRCSAPSYDYETDGSGFDLLGNADGSLIYYNLVEDTAGFIEVGMDSAKNIIIAYNVAVNNGRFSWIHLIGDFSSEVENFRVEHNTIVELGNNSHWLIFGFRGDPNSDTFILRNNIIYVDDHWVVSNKDSFSYSHNLYHLEGGTVLGFDLGAGEQIADPRFVDLAGRDFRLQSQSPAINGGVDLGYTKDFEGNPVPINAAPDMGAFEYDGFPDRSPTPTPIVTPTPLPTPQPGEIIIDDRDPGFSTAFSQDAWQPYTHTEGQHYGDTHYYNREIGTGGDVATWSFTVPQPGRYDVYAWWWAGSWRPSDVPYTMDHLNGSTIVRVNQQIDGAQWYLLGTFEFDGPGSISVSDAVSSGRDVVADAVRLVYVEPLASDSNR